MNKYIEIALAKQVYDLIVNHKGTDSYSSYIQTKDGIKNDESIDKIELIKEIMNSGVSPITVLDTAYEKKPLIWHIFNETLNTKILDIFIDSLKKEHIENLDNPTLRKMYNNISIDDYAGISSRYLKRIFELGFDFEQGTFGETYRAENCNQEFFEICMIYKKDFRFDFKYKEYYLDEVVKEKLDCLTVSAPEYNKLESLMIFLKKAREVYTLKNDLEKDLPANTGKSNTYKI